MKQTLRCFTLVLVALSAPASATPASHYPVLHYSPDSSKGAECAIPPARQQAALAKGLVSDGKFDQAYALAGSAWLYLGACKHGKGDDRTGGDAMFIIAVVEAQRGQHHLANIDSGIAIAEYQFCYQKPGASSDDVAYCHAMEKKIDSMTSP
jgi:hypothetical protein